MDKFNHILYSFIYVELYKLTVLGRLRQSDSTFIESKIIKSISENFREDYHIEIKYEDVSHGYSGVWKVNYTKKRVFKKRYPLKFDLHDDEFILHKKTLRNLTIKRLLDYDERE